MYVSHYCVMMISGPVLIKCIVNFQIMSHIFPLYCIIMMLESGVWTLNSQKPDFQSHDIVKQSELMMSQNRCVMSSFRTILRYRSAKITSQMWVQTSKASQSPLNIGNYPHQRQTRVYI